MNLIFYMHLVITALNSIWNGNGPYESGLELGEWKEGLFGADKSGGITAWATNTKTLLNNHNKQ